MKDRKLGQTGETLSEIGFGAWAIGGNSRIPGYGPTNDRISIKAIHQALDLGCTFFDTADCYGQGHSERILGRVVASHRSDVIISTKAGINFYHGPVTQNFHRDYIRFAVYQSLRRLKSDYIDILLLHNPPSDVLYRDDLIELLQKLKQAGHIRFIGISAANISGAIDAYRAGWPEVIQVTYNILAPEAEDYLLPLAESKKIGIIAREPLANGFLTGKYLQYPVSFPPGDIRRSWPLQTVVQIIRQVKMIKPYCRKGETLAQLAIRFVLESKGISSVICGCKTPAQVRENFRANMTN